MKPSLAASIATLILSAETGCSVRNDRQVRRVETDRGHIQYLHYAPSKSNRQRAILAHGFLRNPETMDSLATALADGGIESVVIDLKRSRLWAGNHEENARDMMALREALGWDRVIYAGFSAGGLSALLAASADDACVRLLMLDPVDSGSQGLDAAPLVGVPALAILGKPGPGNAWRNAAAMLRRIPEVREIEFADARHFDFESPGSSRAASIHQRSNEFVAAWLSEAASDARR